MPDPTTFLTSMAALSAATQTFVEHVVKKNWSWLDDPKPGAADKPRHVAVHVASFVVGGGLAWSVGLNPLTYLGVSLGVLPNALMAGLLVSFGGSLFDETLGAVRQFKKAQESLQQSKRALTSR